MSEILVTGAAGFIGAHLSRALLRREHWVVGVDNFNDYYSPRLKRDRLEHFCDHRRFELIEADLGDRHSMEQLFESYDFDTVYHFGAQAGVRYSLVNPHAYADSNLYGFLNVLEGCRRFGVNHLVYASSSSVYGARPELPLHEAGAADHPISLYAATKRSNELLAHAYAHLYGLPTTGLRLFTVYGPWDRPDKAATLFARGILHGQPIELFNEGRMERDFIYIDDVVDGILLAGDRQPAPDSGPPRPDRAQAPFRIYNLGRGKAVALPDFVAALEKRIGKKADVRFQTKQPGDMLRTECDTDQARRELGFEASVDLDEGLDRFVGWLQSYAGSG